MTEGLADVCGVGTAVPEHVLPQAEAREFARKFFARGLPEVERLIGVFDNTGIAERRLARPTEWYDVPHSFPEKNAVWSEVAIALAERACKTALERADVAPKRVRALVFVSTTGIAAPSPDVRLIARLDLARDLARVPMWGLGCAGGGAGLARAAALAHALEGPVLVVATELCSTTFVHEDRSKSNLVATALFGDGAAAAVLVPATRGRPRGPRILAGLSHLVDDSEDVMGWEVCETGLRVRFSTGIPALVAEIAPGLRARAQELAGAELRHYVLHPGGAKVLQAYERSLELEKGALESAHEVLREHGNMSSPTVLFVLERFCAKTAPRDEAGLLLSLGPGFSAEGVVFSW
jgi:alkylresorcinol/alkylpyrone synthase